MKQIMYALTNILNNLKRDANNTKIYLYPEKIQKTIKNITNNSLYAHPINRQGHLINKEINELHSFYQINYNNTKLGELIFTNKYAHNSNFIVDGLEEIIKNYKKTPRIKLTNYKNYIQLALERKRYPITGYEMGKLD